MSGWWKVELPPLTPDPSPPAGARGDWLPAASLDSAFAFAASREMNHLQRDPAAQISGWKARATENSSTRGLPPTARLIDARGSPRVTRTGSSFAGSIGRAKLLLSRTAVEQPGGSAGASPWDGETIVDWGLWGIGLENYYAPTYSLCA